MLQGKDKSMPTQHSIQNLDSRQEMFLGPGLFVYIHCSFDAIWIPLPAYAGSGFQKKLLPFPLRLPFLQPGLNAFLSVFGLHQLFDVDLLGSSQSLIEMDGVPGVERLLGIGQGYRTKLRKMMNPLLDCLLDLVPGVSRVG